MGGRRPTRSARVTDERGASAVEFAMVVPILFLLVFGIIDYGLWFNQSLTVRQGVREVARAAVVQNFEQPGCSGTPAQKLVCKTKAEIAPPGGQSYARVVVPPAGWTRGAPLMVCGLVPVDGMTGLVPLPAGRMVRSETHMSIENTKAPTIPAGTYGDPAPSGTDWSWCA